MQQPFWESAGGILRLGRTTVTQAGGIRSSAGFATTATDTGAAVQVGTGIQSASTRRN